MEMGKPATGGAGSFNTADTLGCYSADMLQCRHRAMYNVATNDMRTQLAISDGNKDIDQLRKEQRL